MPLFEYQFRQEKFVLLNGGAKGNFCLDFQEENIENIRNYAWSSDVESYLLFKNDYLHLYKWNTFSSEAFSINSVNSNIEKFYQYLRKENSLNSDTIVRFGIQFYKQIRTLLRDDIGNNSLNVLLFLLACIEDNNIDRNALDINKWGITDSVKNSVLQIDTFYWDQLLEQVNNGLKVKELKPNIQLLLRHAAGRLFQEAHFETLFPLSYQASLFLPKIENNLNVKSKEQTSAHFTPTSLVRTIVEEVLREFSFDGKETITVLDPACGSGEFLKEFTRQIFLKGYSGKLKLVGWDVSQSAIDMANFIAKFESRSKLENVEIQISQIDALENIDLWNINADVLLMNPPFISWELMTTEQREQVSLMLGDLSNRRPNTAAAFLWKGINILSEDGYIGCVLPTSIFENDTYQKMRGEIKEIIDVRVVGRLGSHSIFSDALVDAAIFVATRKKGMVKGPVILWSDFRPESNSNALRQLRKLRAGENLISAEGNGFSIYINERIIENETWMPIPYKSFEILNRHLNFPTVEQIFDLKQGVRTGLNAAFLITKEYWQRLSIKEKKFFRPAVTNESINAGRLNDNYYIFYPEGDYKILNREDLMSKVPKYFKDVLEPNYKKLSTRARKGEHNFWKLSEHRAWQIPYTPKIVSKEFGKAGAFAYDKTGAFVAERSHAWLPKSNILGDIGFGYVAILSMPIINDFLNGLSKQIGGGQWYLSSKFINKMPMPNLFDKNYNKDILIQLIDIGSQISSGETIENERLEALSKYVF